MVQRDDLLKGHFSEFRLTWIPVIKSLLSTAVDVGSDCTLAICFVLSTPVLDLILSFVHSVPLLCDLQKGPTIFEPSLEMSLTIMKLPS